MYDDPMRTDWPHPDALDVLCDLDGFIAGCIAERLMRVDELRRAHLARAVDAGRMMTDVVLRGFRLELAAAMRITEYAAGNMIAFASAMLHDYPDVFSSFRDARITERHAEILVSGLNQLEPDLRAGLARAALELAEIEPVGSFRRSLQELIEKARVVTLAERQETALAGRRVFVEPAHDGMAWTHHLGPAVEAHAAYDRATRIAKTILAVEGEERTLDQIRADVFSDLLVEGSVGTHPDAARGIRATVVVTVPVLALLEADDTAVAAAGCDPARVEGVGPIPISKARELCGGDTTWMRVLTHPETGMVLSVGREQYSPPAALKRLVKWRADRCMAPGCGVPASRCDIDHVLAWQDGGSTALGNLAPECRGHHAVKHHGGWVVEQIPGSGGVVRWTSPTGRVYNVEPERRVPVFTVPNTDPPPF